MHVRHERLFRWLERVVPGSRLYGPYDHGGRRYFQWMVRGTALVEWLSRSSTPLTASTITRQRACGDARALRRGGATARPRWSERRIAVPAGVGYSLRP